MCFAPLGVAIPEKEEFPMTEQTRIVGCPEEGCTISRKISHIQY